MDRWHWLRHAWGMWYVREHVTDGHTLTLCWVRACQTCGLVDRRPYH